MSPPRIRFGGRRRHFIVCGDNQLAHRLAEELTTRVDADVTVILQSRRRNHGPEIAKLPGVRVIEAYSVTDEVLISARIDNARALAFVDQNDIGNIHAALRAQELRPAIRLVVRMFDMSLGRQVQQLFADCAVLSDSELAAPWFVAASLGELTPNHVRVYGRTLRIVPRADVDPDRVVCGLADTSIERSNPRLLPADQESADLVLAAADGTPLDPLTYYRRDRAPRGLLERTLRAMVNRKLRIALLAMFGLLLVGTIVSAVIGHQSWADSIYTTILNAAGAAQPDIDADAIEKITQVMVTLVGISLIPLLTAAIVDAVVGARLASATGRLRGPTRDHLIVIGLGNVGSRVVGQLHDLGLPMVCIENRHEAPGVALAQRLGVPVIFADVTQPDTLRLASVDSCRALLALTSDDVTNLQVALSARRVREDLNVVLRLFDADFAQRVERNFGITSSKSVSFLAVPTFAAAMVDRLVIDTIAVGRRVLLIAEVPVGEGSELYGRPVAEVEERGEVRVLALVPRETQRARWDHSSDDVLAADDRMIIIATRAGLGHVLARTIPIFADEV